MPNCDRESEHKKPSRGHTSSSHQKKKDTPPVITSKKRQTRLEDPGVNWMTSKCQAVKKQHAVAIAIVVSSCCRRRCTSHHITHETQIILTLFLFNWDHQRQEMKM